MSSADKTTSLLPGARRRITTGTHNLARGGATSSFCDVLRASGAGHGKTWDEYMQANQRGYGAGAIDYARTMPRLYFGGEGRGIRQPPISIYEASISLSDSFGLDPYLKCLLR